MERIIMIKHPEKPKNIKYKVSYLIKVKST